MPDSCPGQPLHKTQPVAQIPPDLEERDYVRHTDVVQNLFRQKRPAGPRDLSRATSVMEPMGAARRETDEGKELDERVY